MNFEQCFPITVGVEGALSMDPKDPGNWTGGEVNVGELKGTKFGISAASYPLLDIRNLTVIDARLIYLKDYWNRLRISELPDPLHLWVFDFSVNSGTGAVAESLQGAVGVLRDGSIGPKTIAAISTANLSNVVRLMFVDRAMIFALNPNDRRYGRGWFARLFDMTTKTLKEIG